MSEPIGRREFLSKAWMAGLALVGVAGAWTTWDVLRPRQQAGFGGLVRTVPEGQVTGEGVVAVPAARSYLTREGEEILALSRKCPHLGCTVPWCDSSGQFECPCHGSVFNRVGEYRQGPAPRGMDRYPVEVVDGLVVVDTGDRIDGPPHGTETIDEPPRGPSCTEGGEGA